MEEPPATRVPTEIWFHIASMISPEEFQAFRLYGFNSSFLKYYMENKYRYYSLLSQFAPFSYKDRVGFQHQLSRMSNPFIAPSIKHLVINISEWDIIQIGLVMILLSQEGAFFRDQQRQGQQEMLHAYYISVHDEIGSYLKAMENLISISLRISLKSEDPMIHDYHDYRSILNFGVPSHHNLGSLHLTLSFCDQVDFGLSEVHFPNLWEFRFNFYCPNQEAGLFMNNGRKSFTQFMINHSRTITQLVLSFSFRDSTGLDALLLEIPQLQKLMCLSLVMDLEPSSVGLHHLLLLHQSNIIYLQLKLTLPPFNGLAWFRRQAAFEIPFPKSQLLDLGIHGRSEPDIEKAQIIQKYILTVGNQIIRLRIYTKLACTHMESLARELSQPGRRFRLQELDIYLHIFSPYTLATIAKWMPRLHTLKITFLYTGLSDDWPQSSEALNTQVFEAFEEQYFSSWRLKNIFLYQSTEHDRYKRSEDFKAILVHCLPNVQYFNNQTPDRFLMKPGFLVPRST